MLDTLTTARTSVPLKRVLLRMLNIHSGSMDDLRVVVPTGLSELPPFAVLPESYGNR